MEWSIWTIVGGALLLWVLYDLIAGHTWLHREFVRSAEPLLYWPTVALWLVIALWLLGVFER